MGIPIIDLVGKRFGKLVVLEIAERPKHVKSGIYWLCRCDCGTEKIICGKSMKDGHVNSCGCINTTGGRKNFTDLTGIVFGEWTVINFSHRNKTNVYYWNCVCSCGVERKVNGTALTHGTSKCCGHFEDLTGQKFGRLTVVGFSNLDEKGQTVWDCLCECGKYIKSKRNAFVSGHTKSCGCFQRDNSSIVATKTHKENKDKYKHKWYFIDENNNKIRCASSYEVFFWNYYFYIKNILLFYEPETFLMSNGKRYTPDFYIPSQNLWVETKGTFEFNYGQETQENKYIEFSKFHNSRLMFWKEIYEELDLPFKSQSNYAYRANRDGISVEDYLAEMKYYNKEYINANQSEAIS